MKLKALPVFLVFFVMGYVDAVGALTNFVMDEFDLAPAIANLLPMAGFIAFAIWSVPMGLLADKKGKKFVMILCLIIALIGELIPAISIAKYWYILVAIFLIGTAMTGIQVGANAIMRIVSAPGKYSSNLSFAQFVKAISSSSAGWVMPLLMSAGLVWNQLFWIYAVIALVALIGMFWVKEEEEVNVEEKKTASLGSCLSLLGDPFVLLMTLGIFFYVGAEVCMSANIPVYLTKFFDIAKEKASFANTMFFIGLVVGRLSGGFILRLSKAPKIFLMTSILSIVGTASMFISSTPIIYVGALLTGLGYANIFPLIFSILIEYKPERDNELSGLLVTAIVGGAIMPPIMGAVGGMSSMRVSFIVPVLICVYLIILALHSMKVKAAGDVDELEKEVIE